MRFFYACMFSFFVVTTGFLLESNFTYNGNNGGTSKQFLTIAEYYETKKDQQHEHDELTHKIELMRHDSDKTLALPTSQIQNKLSSLEHAVSQISEMNDKGSCDKKYHDLLANYTELQTQFYSLRTEYASLANEQMVTQNKMKSLEENMKLMGELKAVQQVQDLTNLKNKVHTIESQTHSLAVNEQARSQDFLALYNHTIELGKKIAVNSKQVAFTSCDTDNNYVSGSIIKFANVKFQVGFNNSSVLTGTGKFKPSVKGLYQISVSIVSATMDGQFDIYRNGNIISHNFISRSGVYQMATAVLVHYLSINDTVWVQSSSSNLEVDWEGSCLTIIKIK